MAASVSSCPHHYLHRASTAVAVSCAKQDRAGGQHKRPAPGEHDRSRQRGVSGPADWQEALDGSEAGDGRDGGVWGDA
jgi:hypothetical protein